MFTVVTPSFRQLDWLKLCVASVADQELAEVEHIVQDAGTGRSLEEWGRLQQCPRLRMVVESDRGMYDAVNRGLRKGRGELCAYLNCDEQYLPGALRCAADYFVRHPEVDVVLGDAYVVDRAGRYRCTRRALVPGRNHTLVSSNLSYLTCAMFFRRRVVEEYGLYFDEAWRAVGDIRWTLDLLAHRVRFGLLGCATSVFTDTGQNLSRHGESQEELRRMVLSSPAWARWVAPLIVAHYRWRKFLRGGYARTAVSYAIYTRESPAQRVQFNVSRGTGVWPGVGAEEAGLGC